MSILCKAQRYGFIIKMFDVGVEFVLYNMKRFEALREVLMKTYIAPE